MTTITILLPGPPQGKARPRFRRDSGHAYTPERTRAYEKALRTEAALAMRGKKIMTGYVEVTVGAWFPIPESWSSVKATSARHGDVRPGKIDCDNILKVLDALNGIVFKDDAQIVKATVSKHYSSYPRLSVTVHEA